MDDDKIQTQPLKSEQSQPDKIEDITVHTMPKRFLGSQEKTGQQAKGTGLFILIGGVLILAAGLFFVYFYFFKDSNDKAEVMENEIALNEPAAEPEREPMRLDNEPEPAPKPIVKKPATPAPATTIKTATTTMILSTTTAAIATTTIKPTPVIKLQTYKSALDSDSDGLADIEELLLGTNISAQDSDGDGYKDLDEMLNLYNPAGGGTIMVNPNIEKYVNSKYNYSLYYPYVWSIEEVGGQDSIMFKLGNNQFIQIIIQAKASGQSIEEWYKEQMEVAIIKSTQAVYKKGWQGVRSEDGLTVYLAKPNREQVFTVSYNPGASDTINYKQVFEMMINSLEVSN